MKRVIPLLILVFWANGNALAQLEAGITDSTNLSCFESMDGTASVTISGGTGPYEILWDDDSASTELTATDLVADRWYRVTVTDADMTEVKDSVMLSQPDEIIVDLAISKSVECYGPQTGYIKISSSGGMGPHSYKWNGEASSDSITGLTAGKHYYSVIDSTSCEVMDSITLTVADTVVIVFDSILPNPCLGQQKGAIYVSAGGGQMPYSYLWTGPPGFSETTQDISSLKEGLYCLDLTDARGCVYEKDTAIVDADPISVTYSVSSFRDYNLICYGDSSGSISIDTVAGNGEDWRNFTYVWSGPGNYKAYTYDISNLVAGNYFLNVFDNENCRSDVTVTLNQPPPVGVRYDSVITNPCIDDDMSAIYISTINGVAPFSFDWSGPGGFTSSQQNIDNLSKGKYTLSVLDSDACASKSDTTLIQVENIDLVLSISEMGEYNISCFGSDDGFIKIVSIPGYDDLSDFTFLTTGPDGFSSPFRFMTSGVKAGAYHLTATDPQGCSGETDTTLTQPPAVNTGAIEGATKFVHDSDYVYTVKDAAAGSSFEWGVHGGEIWRGQGSGSVEIEWRTKDSGRVKVIETNENGCKGDTVYLETSFLDPTGTDEIPASFKIYPNPVGDILYIKGFRNSDGIVEFFSLLGQSVCRTRLAPQISMDILDRGVYYMRVSSSKGELLLTKKIIKK